MATPQTFMGALDKLMTAERDSPVGRRFIAEGFTLEHTGGGITCWQISKPRFLCWVSLSENEDPVGDADTDGIPSLWTCGIYPLDDDGMMLQHDGPCEDVRGIDAAIAWAKLQMAQDDPMVTL